MCKNGVYLRRMFLVPLSLVIIVWLTARYTPYPQLVDFMESRPAVVISDRNGVEFDVRLSERGTYRFARSLETIPEHVIEAALASEDQRFVWHPGIDPVSILGRLYRVATAGTSSQPAYGGATISMQLARMIRRSVASSPGRSSGVNTISLSDVWNAVRLRARLEPQGLLEQYLNNIPFGYSIEGIEAASRFWFSRSTSELGVRSSYLLMAIPRNPSRYTLQNTPERAVEAAIRSGRRVRLELYHDALFSAVRAARKPNDRATGTASVLLDNPEPSLGLAHFTNRVVVDAADSFVRSTLDLGIQTLLVRATEEALNEATGNRIQDASGIVVDNVSGEVRAYLGASPDRTAYGRSYIDAVRIARSPGSTVKPFLFALAFERGYTPETRFEDEAIQFGSDEIYIPFNFNNQFNGTVTAAVALGSSLNVPAVSLYDQLGQDAFMRYMDDLGMSVFVQEMDRAGLGAVLGAARSSLEELAAAYATLARGGISVPLSFTAVDEARRMEQAGRRVIAESAARQIAEILSSPEYRYLGFPADSFLHESTGVMLKTGTASRFSDILAVAANEQHTVAVWMGNLDGRTVIGQPGSSLPARIALSTINGIP